LVAISGVNAATGVLARYYHRYARWLADAGFAVLTYDYGGIGASRSDNMRTCGYRWQDWGERDFPAAAGAAQRMAPGVRLMVVGHSFGGFIPGMSEAGADVERMLTVGAQYAFWRDYQASTRARLFLKWHFVMPLLSTICGFFPGRYLKWLEDLPKGVALQWAPVGPRWESRIAPHERGRLLQRFRAVLRSLRSSSPTTNLRPPPRSIVA
jgi:predicted alpha/beta hydrolase